MEKEIEKDSLLVRGEEEDIIDLREIYYLLISRWRSLLVTLLAGAVLGSAYCTFLLDVTWQASASLYITNSDSLISLSDLQLSSALTDDYAYIIESRPVLERVIDTLSLDMDYEQLGKLVTVTNPDSSHVIKITVVTEDPEMSRNTVNALLNVSVEQISQIVGNGMPTVVDESVVRAVKQLKPSMVKYALIGAMAAFVVVAGIYVIRMLMDTTIKSEEDVERYLRYPLLASLPYSKGLGEVKDVD